MSFSTLFQLYHGCQFYWWNRFGVVIISVLASSAVDRGFEHRSDQTKDYEN
jgi:hypothetical protein